MQSNNLKKNIFFNFKIKRTKMSKTEGDFNIVEGRAKEALERLQKLQNVTGKFFKFFFLEAFFKS